MTRRRQDGGRRAAAARVLHSAGPQGRPRQLGPPPGNMDRASRGPARQSDQDTQGAPAAVNEPRFEKGCMCVGRGYEAAASRKPRLPGILRGLPRVADSSLAEIRKLARRGGRNRPRVAGVAQNLLSFKTRTVRWRGRTCGPTAIRHVTGWNGLALSVSGAPRELYRSTMREDQPGLRRRADFGAQWAIDQLRLSEGA